MNAPSATLAPMPPARRKLLDAAMIILRKKGYAATTVDDLCAAAGVAKGSFFHHFDGKEALAVAAAEYWSATTGALFAAAPYHAPDDPLDRVLGYIDFRKAILMGEPAAFSCVAGTLLQETFETHPAIRDACAAAIFDHAARLEADIDAAIARHGIAGGVTAASLARHAMAVLQGAFILAKATGDAAIAASSVDHLRRYVGLLFSRPEGASP
ncbi:TetR/AcrR family transcriptional regulator [Pleomorphomonas koreensis]|uniref:TetR/AcrR family transcriptional regulator n=1 Tax=Pleomorphomonas koreensis TaxID=257440 RepID=UPI0009FCA411|nr:TetR/AcrR family transcriptional regulator [Pleomorphomonas koreensis]